MQLLIWNELDEAGRRRALSRPRLRTSPAIRMTVGRIVDDIRRRGWAPLCRHAARIDGAVPRRVEVAPFAAAARRLLTREQREALELAAANIARFHETALPGDVAVMTMPGLRVRKMWRPIEPVGLYVPGGPPALFSTLMMLAIPARIAGVKGMVVATPPRADGTIDPVLALAAEMCGIEAIWTVGGAQAIAAMAFGAGEIPRVAKICGPGNVWVNEAKIRVASLPDGPAIDLPAGPSELLVIADDSADPRSVAADLLSQAEHDPSAQVILVATSMACARQVEVEIEAQVRSLPRAVIAADALRNGRIILADSIDRAVEIANLYAPEHLSLAVRHAERLLGRITNAGAVFVGGHAAEAFGDYLAGSSHVLPTDGAARAWSGVSVHSFMKAITVQEVSELAARAIAGPAAALARLEGLEAHARAAGFRLSEAAE